MTVGVDLGPRTAVAKFSPQAQAAYAFVSALFSSLYDHMPVYTAEPSGAERAAAAVLLETAVAGGVPPPTSSTGLSDGDRPSVRSRPRATPAPGERIPA